MPGNFFFTEREKLEHLETTEMIERNHTRGKQGEKMLDGPIKRLNVGGVTDALTE